MAARRNQPAKRKCMVPGCRNLCQQQGVCKTCFRENTKLVEDGKFTADQLVNMGLWLPEGKRGPKPAARVQKVLERPCVGAW